MGIFVCAKRSVASALNWNLVVVNKSNGRLLRKVSCEVSRLVVGKTNDCEWIHFMYIFCNHVLRFTTFEHTYMHNILCLMCAHHG